MYTFKKELMAHFDAVGALPISIMALSMGSAGEPEKML
jgi:hypothetical protein